jgi:hypothetical protein
MQAEVKAVRSQNDMMAIMRNTNPTNSRSNNDQE